MVVEQALFPNYLFIRLQAGVDNSGPVRSTRGVAYLVGFGNVPVPFDATFVESLRRHLAAPADGAPGGPGEAAPRGLCGCGDRGDARPGPGGGGAAEAGRATGADSGADGAGEQPAGRGGPAP